MIASIKNSNQGAVALLLVIMITSLTIVAAAVVSMTNISDLMSSYHFSEAEEANVEIDACLEDALLRLSSTTAASGTYYLNDAGTNCYYQLDSDIDAGLKILTSTASTSSGIGFWQDTVVTKINVSTTPISIYSYKHSTTSYASFEYCGDGECNGGETGETCSEDCASAECGNGVVEGAEICDDGVDEICGDGIYQNGSYCNSTCDGYDTLTETCDYTPGSCNAQQCCTSVGLGCATGRRGYQGCTEDCSTCQLNCVIF